VAIKILTSTEKTTYQALASATFNDYPIIPNITTKVSTSYFQLLDTMNFS
jgi:hypothetical protein